MLVPYEKRQVVKNEMNWKDFTNTCGTVRYD